MQRGIAYGILIAMLLYLAINYAYIQVIGYEKMKNANAIGTLLCEAWFGKSGAKVFDLCMILSVLAYVNVVLLSNPRVMYAMSKDGILPKIFTYRHPKTNALVPALTIYAALTAVIALIGKKVDDVLSFSIFLDCIGMATSAATVFILRKRKTGEQNVVGGIKKFVPVFAAVFVAAYSLVAVAVVIDKPKAAFTGTCLLILFAVLYFGFYHKKSDN
jgi:APA family basic amino acid/polyamine antiporter